MLAQQATALAVGSEALILPIPDISFGLNSDLRGRGISGIIEPTFARATVATRIWNGKVSPVASGDPRFQADSNPLGVLIEGARTNSILQSRAFDTTWSNTGTTLTQDQIGIDGVVNTAWTIEDDSGAAVELITQAVTIPNDSNTHCYSIYVLKDSDETRFPEFQLNLSGGTDQYIRAQINTKTGATNTRLSSGTVSIDIESVGDWWRVNLTVANNSTGNTSAIIRVVPANGNTLGGNDVSATGSIIIDAAQLELNSSFPSSFIETTTVAVTRNADSLSYALGSWFNTSEGTIVVEVNVPYVGTTSARLITISDGTSSNRIILFRNGGDDTQLLVTDGGATQAAINAISKWVDGQTSKIAIAWKANDFVLYQDGDNLGGDSAGTIPTGLDTLGVGITETGADGNAFSNIKNINYYTSRLPNADLARLSA